MKQVIDLTTRAERAHFRKVERACHSGLDVEISHPVAHLERTCTIF